MRRMALVEVRNRIETGFEAYGAWLVRHRWSMLLACLALIAASMARLPEMRFDNSTEGFLRDDDPTKELYQNFRRDFGSDHQIMVAVSPPDIFDLAFLAQLRDFHQDLERSVPHIEDITSLLNARDTRGEEDSLIVGELLEDWPENEQDLRALRERVLGNPLFLDNLISRDETTTTLTLKPITYSDSEFVDEVFGGFEETAAPLPGEAFQFAFLTIEEQSALVKALTEVIERWEGPDFRIHAAGSSLMMDALNGGMIRDAKRHVGVAMLAIAAVLFVLFRRPSGVLLPLVLVVATLSCTLGLMIVVGIPYSLTLGMLPVFMVTVGVCNAVHLLAIVYQRLAANDPIEAAIPYAFKHSGLAIFMTSLTTAAGLMSFLTSHLAPMQHLGLVGPIGVMATFFFTVTLLPALLAILPIRTQLTGTNRSRRLGVERVLVRVGDVSAHYPWRTLVPCVLVAGVILCGLPRLRLSHDPLSWLPEDMPVRVAAEFIDEKLRGSASIEAVVHTGRENGLKDPETLRRMEIAMRFAESFERGGIRVGKAISLVDIVKETNQALHENQSAYYTLPDDARLIAQELMLFENAGTDDLEDFTDTPFRSGRISMRVPNADGALYEPFLDEMQRGFARILGPDLPFDLTGVTAVHARTMGAMVASMVRSYSVAFMVITPLMMLLIGSLRLGIVSMVPNLLPVGITLGMMGWLDIPIDPSNVIIGSIIIGLSVDDTIHFMHRFQGDFAETGDVRAAVRSTLSTTGSALLFTSLVLTLGFVVLAVGGTMKNTMTFGYLAAFGISVAFVADILMCPALIALTKGKRL